MPELIENGKNGFLVGSVDEAVQAVRKTAEIDRRTCRNYVEQSFTAERMADEYLEVYEKIVELQGRRA